MAKEQYVGFDVSKMLDRNGFSAHCQCYYKKDGTRLEHRVLKVLQNKEKVYDCPTQAVVMRWLREEYRLAVVPLPYRYPGKWTVMLVYLGQPKEKDDRYDTCNLGKTFESYEDAAEYGIRYALKHLVNEIRKKLMKQTTDNNS